MIDPIEFYYIVPLYNVDPTGMKPQILPEGYELISNKEFFEKYQPLFNIQLRNLAEDIQLLHPGQLYERATASYLLIKKLSFKKEETPLGTKREISDKVYAAEQDRLVAWIFALRLLNPGNIQVYQIYSISYNFYSSFYFSIGTIIPNLESFWNFGKGEIGTIESYPLGKVDPHALQEIINKCKQNYTVMKLPLNYWLSYYQERDLINKLLRLTTVWETTVLNDRSSELQYALEIRGSYVLAKDTRHIFKLAYQLRSELLHTGVANKKTIQKINSHLNFTYKSTWATFFYFIKDTLEPITREILLYFLNTTDKTKQNLEKIAQQLDENICALSESSH